MSAPDAEFTLGSPMGLGPERPDLSIVVPIYNEVGNLRPLRAAIGHALDHERWSYEVLLVDDASTDGSRELYQEMLKGDPRLRVVLFRRNSGQTAAMAAGFRYAQGDTVVTMDGDLQNDPADIPRLVEKLEQGYDIVCGWRRERQDRALTRLLPSRLANIVIRRVTGVPIHDTGCSLKVYRGWVVHNLTLFSDMHRFIAALSVGVGARITELPVRHHARRFGESKYGLTRIFKVAVDLFVVKLLIQFSAHPIRWFALLCIPTVLLTFGLIAGGTFRNSAEGWLFEPRYDTLMVAGAAVCVMVTGIVFLLGFLAELQLRASGYFRRQLGQVGGLGAGA